MVLTAELQKSSLHTMSFLGGLLVRVYGIYSMWCTSELQKIWSQAYSRIGLIMAFWVIMVWVLVTDYDPFPLKCTRSSTPKGFLSCICLTPELKLGKQKVCLKTCAFHPQNLMSLRMAVRKIFLTERNTGLDTPNSYPILGRSWKAAHIKVLVWYFTIKAIEFANATGVPKLYIRLATSLSCIKSVFFWAPKNCC